MGFTSVANVGPEDWSSGQWNGGEPSPAALEHSHRSYAPVWRFSAHQRDDVGQVSGNATADRSPLVCTSTADAIRPREASS